MVAALRIEGRGPGESLPAVTFGGIAENSRCGGAPKLQEMSEDAQMPSRRDVAGQFPAAWLVGTDIEEAGRGLVAAQLMDQGGNGVDVVALGRAPRVAPGAGRDKGVISLRHGRLHVAG